MFEPTSWRQHLQGAVGVISTLGGFGSNDFMFKARRPTPVADAVAVFSPSPPLLGRQHL